MTNTAINTIIAKLFTKLAHLDLTAGIRIAYVDGSITAHIRGRTHHLTTTDSPSTWALDGRRNWRAIKALCIAVCEAGDEPHATTPEVTAKPGDVATGPQVRIMSSREVKALLADAPKKKGEPKPSPVQSTLSAKPKTASSASDILASFSKPVRAKSPVPQAQRRKR